MLGFKICLRMSQDQTDEACMVHDFLSADLLEICAVLVQQAVRSVGANRRRVLEQKLCHFAD